jgi:hypothetical protein
MESIFQYQGVISLPQLREIILNTLSPYTDPGWSIISYLIAPAIHAATLKATLQDGTSLYYRLNGTKCIPPT